ncbi:MAG: hypothetical protein ACXAC6_09175 [Candidatus Hodarchaeales archaeon]
MSIQAKLPVVSFFSLTNIVEKTIIITNTAKSYCRQGYRTLLIDLDFTVPLIYTTLQTSKMLKFDCITTNDWLLDSDFDLEEVITQLQEIKVTDEDLPELVISPCGSSNTEIRKWQAFSDKEISKYFRRLNKLVRIIKKSQTFDMILLNLPNNLRSASFPIISSSFCFAITDHDVVSNTLLRANLDAIIGIHPLLKMSGVIVDKFKFEYPEKDEEERFKLEEILQIPILSTLPSLRSEKYVAQETLIDWSTHSQPSTENLFEKLTSEIDKFRENPRVVKKKSKIRLYSLFVISHSGLPALTHYFLPQSDTNEILASAGLSSLISGVSAMIGEIVNKEGQTKLIELQKVKLVIEDLREFKLILLVSEYEESQRDALKRFGRAFMHKYQKEIKQFLDLSIAPNLADIESLLQKYF